jgi:tRNA dimethylallyltransferase
MASSANRIILVIGPTASGKSHYAQSLATQRGGEIVNYDSQQFYRGLDIGTGKLPEAERKVPHWLLDTLDPGEYMTAGEFARRSETIIAELFAREKIPIFAGGTGLYIRSLLEGIDDLPPRDPSIRDCLERELEEKGWDHLYRRLQKIDPVQAGKILPNDRLRVVRFLEIYEISGRPPSQLFSRGEATQLRYPTETHWLCPPRESLREKIAKRVEKMFAEGWAREVEGFLNRGEDPRQWENKPIGYAELAGALAEGQDPSGAVPDILKKTRAYAKRQETFFKGMLARGAYQNFGSTLKILENFGEVI